GPAADAVLAAAGRRRRLVEAARPVRLSARPRLERPGIERSRPALPEPGARGWKILRLGYVAICVLADRSSGSRHSQRGTRGAGSGQQRGGRGTAYFAVARSGESSCRLAAPLADD